MHLPRSNVVVSDGLETASINGEAVAEAASILTTKASSFSTAEARVSTAEATTDADRSASKVEILVFVVSAIVPLDVVAVFRDLVFEEVRNILLRLDQDLDEVFGDVLVAVIVERCCLALVANASSATNAVDVFGDTIVLSGRQIIVDDMLDVGDVQSTGSDTSGNHDRTLGSAESTQGIFALSLSAIRVDGRRRKTLVVEEVINHVALDLAVDEDEGALRTVGEDQVKESLVLLVLVDVDDLLLDVLMRATNAADLDANIVLIHVLPSESTSFLREGGREHEISVVGIGIGIRAAKQLLHSLLPTAREELVGFVEDSELETSERQQVHVLHEVHQTSRSGNEDVAPHLELLALVPAGGAAVDDARAQHGAIAETTSLIEDLARQLASGADDENERLGTNSVSQRIVSRRVGAGCRKLASLAHQLGEDGKQECSSLAGAGLSDSDDVMACEDRRDAVALDRSRRLVLAELDVVEHDWVKACLVELAHWLDRLRADDIDMEAQSLDLVSNAHALLAFEEHLLQLRVLVTDVAEVVVPLVDGRVGEPHGAVAGVVCGRLATVDGGIVEWDRVVPTSIAGLRNVLGLLLQASGSGLVDSGSVVSARVGHGVRRELSEMVMQSEVEKQWLGWADK